MRTTLFLKRIDLWAQLLALAIPFIIAVVTGNWLYIMGSYISVGAVQVLSFVMNHKWLNKFYRSAGRDKYGVALASALAAIVVLWGISGSGNNDNIFLLMGFGLLLLSPLMAIWYGIMTVYELDLVKAQVDRKQYV